MGEDAVSALNVISINHPNDVEKCFSVMFTKWKQRKPKANWKNVIDALKLDQVASELEALLLPSVVSNEQNLHLPLRGILTIISGRAHMFM